VAIAPQGERRQLLGLLDELLTLLVQLHHILLGVGPAIDEADHRLNQAAKKGATLIRLTTKLVTAEFIHQLVTGVFDVAGQGGDDLQHFVHVLANGCFPGGKIKQTLLQP
jgi:hypothetical protein